MTQPQTLPGRRVLITGGGVGIGLGIARRFASAGAHIALTTHSRDPQEAVDALAADGLEAIGATLDATDSAAVDRVIDDLAAQLGGLDVVVNNAGGMVARQKVAEMSDELWNDVLTLNLTSTFYASRAALRHLGRDGRIINITSLAGRNGGSGGAAAYATAKAAIDGFTRALAKETAPDGITVNAIAPGIILDTPFHDKHSPDEMLKQMLSGILVGRPGHPADVAAAAEYFARTDSGFTTGVVVDLNGGVHFS